MFFFIKLQPLVYTWKAISNFCAIILSQAYVHVATISLIVNCDKCVDPEIFSKGEEGLVQDLHLVTCFTKRRGAPTPGYPSP